MYSLLLLMRCHFPLHHSPPIWIGSGMSFRAWGSSTIERMEEGKEKFGSIYHDCPSHNLYFPVLARTYSSIHPFIQCRKLVSSSSTLSELSVPAVKNKKKPSYAAKKYPFTCQDFESLPDKILIWTFQTYSRKNQRITNMKHSSVDTLALN